MIMVVRLWLSTVVMVVMICLLSIPFCAKKVICHFNLDVLFESGKDLQDSLLFLRGDEATSDEDLLLSIDYLLFWLDSKFKADKLGSLLIDTGSLFQIHM
jgi:hypothetical protein